MLLEQVEGATHQAKYENVYHACRIHATSLCVYYDLRAHARSMAHSIDRHRTQHELH